MKDVIKGIVECQDRLYTLKQQLDNPAYWIDKAKEEAGFVEEEGKTPWVHVEVTLWKIEISVYSSHNGSSKCSRFWINGEWFNTSFPEKYPYKINLETLR